jgi:ribonuclease VapC
VIVDASALLAIVFREPGYEDLIARLTTGEAVAVGAPTLAGTGIILQARLGANAHGMLERLLGEFAIEEIPFAEVHWREAVEAYRRYGKGRHAANLNFGDCMTYAIAKLVGEPLLFTGRDFALTDVYRA